VAAVLAAGETDWRTVQLAITRTEFVSDSVIERLDWRLATRVAKWHCWSRKRIINAIDAIVRVMDPDAIRERARREDKRHVKVIAQADGTAKLDAAFAAEAGIAFDKRLTEPASAVCRDDPRTVDQRRADALKAFRRVAYWHANAMTPTVPIALMTPLRRSGSWSISLRGRKPSSAVVPSLDTSKDTA
jgi:hypothetical protein